MFSFVICDNSPSLRQHRPAYSIRSTSHVVMVWYYHSVTGLLRFVRHSGSAIRRVRLVERKPRHWRWTLVSHCSNQYNNDEASAKRSEQNGDLRKQNRGWCWRQRHQGMVDQAGIRGPDRIVQDIRIWAYGTTSYWLELTAPGFSAACVIDTCQKISPF